MTSDMTNVEAMHYMKADPHHVVETVGCAEMYALRHRWNGHRFEYQGESGTWHEFALDVPLSSYFTYRKVQ